MTYQEKKYPNEVLDSKVTFHYWGAFVRIGLFAFRNSFAMFISGFLLAMGSLVIDQPLKVMFIVLIVSGFVSDITGSISRIYYYRRGV
ncbi:hypothetical protein PAECIP111892_04920 [Paenibacillus auburnensis]|uniref:Uncharacterized protein n=1 Tax=Paenibacillus auburnensis TaxID=2905649 RepID=A0ABM9CS85_9BACL|nr:hypothetical protein PAECIP111892_04920 [Paenibacillus auburnensis]